MRSLMNLENGMVVAERHENSRPVIQKKYCKCYFCMEPIYVGEIYYDLPEGRVCEICIDNCKKEAVDYGF